MEIKDGFTVVRYMQQLWGWHVATTPEGFVISSWWRVEGWAGVRSCRWWPVQLFRVAIWIILPALCFALGLLFVANTKFIL